MTDGLNRRSVKADSGKLFLSAWLFAIGYYLAQGRLHVVGALGFCLLPFCFGLAILLLSKANDNRLRNAVVTAGIITLLAFLGNMPR